MKTMIGGLSVKKALALLLLATSAAAQQPNQGGNFYSGNDLHDRCETQTVAKQNFCFGYVAAIADANRYRQCSPADITLGQLKDVVSAYLRANPANRHMDADVLVLAAINQAWPCAQQQNRNTYTPGRNF